MFYKLLRKFHIYCKNIFKSSDQWNVGIFDALLFAWVSLFREIAYLDKVLVRTLGAILFTMFTKEHDWIKLFWFKLYICCCGVIIRQYKSVNSFWCLRYFSAFSFRNSKSDWWSRSSFFKRLKLTSANFFTSAANWVIAWN